MAKLKSSPNGSEARNGHLPLRADRRSVLEQVSSINESLWALIENAHRGAAKGARKNIIRVQQGIAETVRILQQEIPDFIHTKAPDVFHTADEFDEFWDRVEQLAISAKNAAPFELTKQLQRRITASFTEIRSRFHAVLHNATPSSDQIAANESLAQHPVNDLKQNVLAPDLNFSSGSATIVPSEPSSEHAMTLSEVLEILDLDTPESQAEYIVSKLHAEAARAFTDYLAAIRVPAGYASKTPASDVHILLKLFTAVEDALSGVVQRGDLQFETIRDRLRSSLPIDAFMPLLEKLKPEARFEFYSAVCKRLSTLWDTHASAEECYDSLIGAQSTSSFRKPEDVVFCLQWEAIEQGDAALLTPAQEVFLRGKFGKRLRDWKALRNNKRQLENVTADFNRAFFGGFECRSSAFVERFLEDLISHAEGPKKQIVIETPVLPATVKEEASISEVEARPVETEEFAILSESVPLPLTEEPRMDEELVVPNIEERSARHAQEEKAAVHTALAETSLSSRHAFGAQEISLMQNELQKMKIKRPEEIHTSHRVSLWANVMKAMGKPREHGDAKRQWRLIHAAFDTMKFPEQIIEAVTEGVFVQSVENPDVATDQERRMIKTIFVRELASGEIDTIPDGRINIFLMGTNMQRVRRHLPQRDAAFARALIKELAPPVVPAVEDDVIADTEVDEAVDILESTEGIDNEVEAIAPVNVEHVVHALPEEMLKGTPAETLLPEEEIEAFQDTAVPIPEKTDVQPEERETLDDESRRLLLFARGLHERVQEDLRLARDSLSSAELILSDLKASVLTLRKDVEDLNVRIGDLLHTIFSEDNRELLTISRLPIEDLRDTDRLQRTYNDVAEVLASVEQLRTLQSDCSWQERRAEELIADRQSAYLAAQRANDFGRKITKAEFVSLLEILPQDDRKITTELWSFNNELAECKRDLDDVKVTYLASLALDINTARLGGSMNLDDVLKEFESSKKRLEKALHKDDDRPRNGSEESPEVVLSPLQLRLMQILTAQTASRHPRFDTWGRTPGKLIKFWKKIFDDDPPSEEEIVDALANPAICDDRLDSPFVDRPNKATLKPLRESSSMIVRWRFEENTMFLPTLQGFELIERGNMALPEPERKKLEAYVAAGKELGEKIRAKKKMK